MKKLLKSIMCLSLIFTSVVFISTPIFNASEIEISAKEMDYTLIYVYEQDTNKIDLITQLTPNEEVVKNLSFFVENKTKLEGRGVIATGKLLESFNHGTLIHLSVDASGWDLTDQVDLITTINDEVTTVSYMLGDLIPVV